MAVQPRPAVSLRVEYGKNRGSTFELTPGRWTIGRDRTAEIRLDDDVGLVHAVIDNLDGHSKLTDLGSGGGTWLNQAPLSGTAELIDGDRIRLGIVSLSYSANGVGSVTHPAVVSPDSRPRASRTSIGGIVGPTVVGSGPQFNTYGPVPELTAWDELFQGKGFGHRLLVVGACGTLGGVLAFVYAVLSLFVFAASGSSSGEIPDSGSADASVTLAAVGFAVVVASGFLSSAGIAMSKAAREKAWSRNHPGRR